MTTLGALALATEKTSVEQLQHATAIWTGNRDRHDFFTQIDLTGTENQTNDRNDSPTGEEISYVRRETNLEQAS